MRLLKTSLKTPMKTMCVAAIVGVMAAAPALAQTKPPAQPPAQPTKPTVPAPAPSTPAPSTPAPSTPAPAAPAAPTPYPEGAKMAYVDLQQVASGSNDGKAATTKLQELDKKKVGEITEKNKALESARTKRTAASTDAAQLTLDKEIDKLTREVQYMQQEAQAEREQLQEELRLEFQKKLFPVLEAIGKEKGLQVIVDAANSGAFWADRGLDLTAELIKRLDAGKPAATPPKK